MNACANMAMPTYGRSSLNFSITCLSLQLYRIRSSVSMVVSHPPSTLSTRLDSLTAFKKSLMRVPSAIYYGLTLMIAAVGASHPVVLVTPSVRTFLNNSTMRTASPGLLELISSWWMVTIGRTSATLWQSSLLLTTATDAAMRLPLWKSMSTWTATCKY